MTNKEPRSYAKESTKSKPTGIRFDIEKSDLVKGREKLNTFQKVVDFLLNKYWWEHKVAKPSHKGLPPDELNTDINFIPTSPSVYDGKKFNTNIDEPKQWQEPTNPKSVIRYIEERINCDTADSYDRWLQELESDPYLSQKDKQKAKTDRLT